MSMPCRKWIILMILLILCIGNIYAQKHKMKPFFRGRYKAIKVPRSKARIVCPIFEESKYPYQGIGIKLGDPFAATYKFYATKKFAMAFDFGSAASGLYSKYHSSNFEQLTQPDTLAPRQSVNYLGHTVKSEWVFEAKLLYHHNAVKLLKGLQWYGGAGIQWRKLDLDYEYVVEINIDENAIALLNVKRVALGATAVLGVEYAYFELPISAFMELATFVDMVEDPGWARFQGGVGIRYVF